MQFRLPPPSTFIPHLYQDPTPRQHPIKSYFPLNAFWVVKGDPFGTLAHEGDLGLRIPKCLPISTTRNQLTTNLTDRKKNRNQLKEFRRNQSCKVACTICSSSQFQQKRTLKAPTSLYPKNPSSFV